MTPRSVAEPAGEPQAVLVAECAHCGRPIMRLSLESAKWRHDNQAVACPSLAVTVEEAPEGDPGMEAVQAWFRNGGRCCGAHHFEGCTDGGPGCCPRCPINPWPTKDQAGLLKEDT